ncbi:MAG TPA: GNAT family N-acetyltransferase [Micromonosporaceae bacterium]
MGDEPVDVGAALRALRRRASLSQRELAERARVPQSTIARIEADRGDSHFGTVVALVRAAGGDVRIVASRGDALEPPPDHEPRDAAGRRYPAHVDVREVLTAGDWWGGWWSGTGPSLPRATWPRAAPRYTFDLDRRRRDAHRGDAARLRAAARAEVRRVESHDDTACTFVALVEGRIVGWLIASIDPTLPDCPRGATIHRVEVHPAWRAADIAGLLVTALRAEFADAGVTVARATADDVDVLVLLLRSGFRRTRSQAMRLDVG